MYTPNAFRVDDRERLQELMRERPLATLVGHGPDGLEATHAPLLYAPDGAHGVLRGHVARANPLWRILGDGLPALAIFHGPQAYVSPGMYPTKRDDPRVVPTWNYAVVHAHGMLRAVDDATWLHALVRALTEVHEASRPEPWRVDDAPDDYLEKMVRAVVGIELVIERLEGKWKMSQNRGEVDRGGVAAGLRARGDAQGAEVAALVENPPPGSGNG